MNKSIIFLCIPVTILLCAITGCRKSEPCPHKTQIVLLKEQLTKCQSLAKESSVEGFQHLVYFDLKDDLTPQAILKFEQLLSSLSEVPGVENLRFGKFKDLQDQRALSSYEYVLTMHFLNQDDYIEYQKDPKHLLIQKEAAVFLMAPPSTYDYE